jgi:hypothetical protein
MRLLCCWPPAATAAATQVSLLLETPSSGPGEPLPEVYLGRQAGSAPLTMHLASTALTRVVHLATHLPPHESPGVLWARLRGANGAGPHR